MPARTGRPLVLAASSLFALAACGTTIGSTPIEGSGTITTDSRSIGSFSGISIEGPFETTVSVGGQPAVTVTADDNLLPYIVTRVDGGTLVVGFKDDTSIHDSHALRVQITTPNLSRAKAEAAAHVSVSGIAGPRFEVEVDAAAQLTAAGSADSISVSGSAGSVARLADVRAGSATVDLDAAAVAELTVSGEVTGSAKAASVVRVHGHPSSVRVSTEAAATVVSD